LIVLTTWNFSLGAKGIRGRKLRVPLLL